MPLYTYDVDDPLGLGGLGLWSRTLKRHVSWRGNYSLQSVPGGEEWAVGGDQSAGQSVGVGRGWAGPGRRPEARRGAAWRRLQCVRRAVSRARVLPEPRASRQGRRGAAPALPLACRARGGAGREERGTAEQGEQPRTTGEARERPLKKMKIYLHSWTPGP